MKLLDAAGPDALHVHRVVGRHRVMEVDAVDHDVARGRIAAELHRRHVLIAAVGPAGQPQPDGGLRPDRLPGPVDDADPGHRRRATVAGIDRDVARDHVAHRHVITGDIEPAERHARARHRPELHRRRGTPRHPRDRLRRVRTRRDLDHVAGRGLAIRVAERLARRRSRTGAAVGAVRGHSTGGGLRSARQQYCQDCAAPQGMASQAARARAAEKAKHGSSLQRNGLDRTPTQAVWVEDDSHGSPARVGCVERGPPSGGPPAELASAPPEFGSFRLSPGDRQVPQRSTARSPGVCTPFARGRG